MTQPHQPKPNDAHEPAPGQPRGGGGDDAPPFRYTARLADQVERRWQDQWEKDGTFKVANPGQPGFDFSRPKFYCLDMFPYPSGAGLHVGHPEGYTATDILCRYKRMRGFNVLHPMGWDAFGLPAEQYALTTGIHPSITTRKAIDNFRRQLKRFGFSYDWSREFGTIDANYYKWTQWIFLQIYNAWYDADLDQARPISELIHELERGMIGVGPSGEMIALGGAVPPAITGEASGVRMWHEMTPEERRAFIDNQRLAYLAEQTVNWCPKLGTALANDEITADGLSERGHYPVFKKPLRQWMFRITAYAERLLQDLQKIDWPSSTKTMQAEWIGKSEGAEVDFALDLEPIEPAFRAGIDPALRVFTTRPDTIFGATYMVVAPEHPLVDAILKRPPAEAGGSGGSAALRAYVEKARNLPEVERMENKQKTGVFSGLHAINPATDEKIPVWIADYVLMGYGHGAIMAVPAHDDRDFDFARKYELPIVRVVQSAGGEPGFGIELADGEVPMSEFDTITAKFGYPECFSEGPWIREIAFRTQRDAQKFADDRLQRKASLKPVKITGFLPFSDTGTAVKSANAEVSLDGLATADAKNKIIEWVEAEGLGRRQINYKLHDWVFSRQRYWGEPFPIVYDEQGNHYPVNESALPVVLPPLDDYHPVESDDPQPLLAKAREWMNTTAGEAGVPANVLPPETRVRRETNTMPGSAGSSWYAVRYCDPWNDAIFAGPEAQRYWMGTSEEGESGSASGTGSGSGVDLYLGGSEHAVGHLLYARFWQKVLFDLGHVACDEPFRKLFHQGLITSFAYQRPDKSVIAVDEVREVSEGQYVEIATGKAVAPIVTKMSKRYKNVINPDDVIAEFGADTFRLYEMYMGPLDASKPWNPRDIIGLHRFLQKLWRLTVDEQTGQLRIGTTEDPALEKQLHRATAKVAQDIERLAFNTAIAAMIEFVNAATSAVGAGGSGLTKSQIERLTLTLSPFAPHMAEELWHKLGHTRSAALANWPVVDASKLVDDEVEIPVQVLGKVRARLMVPAKADSKMIEAAALADERVQEHIAGKPVKKVIVVPGKMVNVVV